MKKIILTILTMLLCLSGCYTVPEETDEGRSFRIRINNGIENGITTLSYVYYVDGVFMGGGEVGRADGKPTEKGETFDLQMTEKNFKDPDSINSFMITFNVVDGDDEEYEVLNKLVWDPEYGNTYELTLTDKNDEIVAENSFTAEVIDGLYDYKINTIGMEMFHMLFKENENAVVSPLSLEIALNMLFDGAAGNTLAQFDDLNCGFTEINTELARTANSIWIDDELEVYQTYVDKLKAIYDAEAFNCDLSGDTYKDINKWVFEKTNEMIRDLLTEPLSKDAALALINTLYFKAKWMNEMTDGGTREFHTSNGNVVNADFMKTEGQYACIDFDGYEGVVIPYEDDNTYYIAVKGKDLSSLTNYYLLSELLKTASDQKAVISLPKYETETRNELNEILMEMGLTDVFDPEKADLSGIADVSNENLYVSKVLQKSRIKVDTAGTEAASATAIIAIKNSAANPTNTRFISFDEPFVYFIINNSCVLFAGIVNDPTRK